MKLARLGCFHQTRLSFMRSLLRQLKRQGWGFERQLFDIDRGGEGVAVYQARGPEHTYSLVCFAHDLPPQQRSDRVIAERWDATFVLFDGVPGRQDIDRLREVVPLQEAAQCSERELVLSRANRSVRMFEHVVASLSAGNQPDPAMIEQVGYLMRTTAVYGNGKFGLSDRERIAMRSEFHSAFRSELLAVWLIRWFTVDIAEHMARVRGGADAVALDPDIRRRIGVGNSTGLGMAPFLVTHPALLHTWINARETALARVRGVYQASAEAADRFRRVLGQSQSGLAGWHTVDRRQQSRIEGLKMDLEKIGSYIDATTLEAPWPWDNLVNWSENTLTMEGQELLVSMVIEPYGELVDDLADRMAINESPYQGIDGGMTMTQLRQLIDEHYQWTLDTDFDTPRETDRFWYVSEEKLEPRLGQRYQEPGAKLEQPLAFGREIQQLYRAIENLDGELSVACFLIADPQYRNAVRRLQMAAQLPYAEIRDNLIGADMVPVDLLRCKLSFFGASGFDPRSDRWIRINMYQGAPLPDEFAQCEPDQWSFDCANPTRPVDQDA